MNHIIIAAGVALYIGTADLVYCLVRDSKSIKEVGGVTNRSIQLASAVWPLMSVLMLAYSIRDLVTGGDRNG